MTFLSLFWAHFYYGRQKIFYDIITPPPPVSIHRKERLAGPRLGLSGIYLYGKEKEKKAKNPSFDC